jgi:hypothetical protein
MCGGMGKMAVGSERMNEFGGTRKSIFFAKFGR